MTSIIDEIDHNIMHNIIYIIYTISDPANEKRASHALGDFLKNGIFLPEL